MVILITTTIKIKLTRANFHMLMIKTASKIRRINKGFYGVTKGNNDQFI